MTHKKINCHQTSTTFSKLNIKVTLLWTYNVSAKIKTCKTVILKLNFISLMLIVVIYLPLSSLTIILFYIVSVITLLLKTFLLQEEAFPEKRFLAKILKNMEYSLKEVPEARNTIDF